MEFEPTEDDLLQLREWLQKSPHILQHYDNQFLAALVRARKGSLQKTKAIIENINALGMRHPTFFGTFDPLYPRLQETLSIGLLFPLPKKAPNDSIVFFLCLNTKVDDPSKYHYIEYYRYLLLTVYILLWENDFGSGQMKLVFDAKGVTFAHVKEATPMVLKEVLTIAESGLPVRIKSVNGYNIPSLLEFLFTVIKSLAKSKLAQRINFYRTIDPLIDDIPQNILPKEYGGSEESVFVLHDNWRKKVESYRERFLEEARLMRELDHLRPQTEGEDEMAGTFRHLLNVD